MILLQSLNLAVYNPEVFWDTSVLLVQSGCLEMEDSGDEELDENKKEKSTNYGKVATAISNLQKNNIEVEPPKINEAEAVFKAQAEDNSILFGLQGITNVNKEAVSFILNNRPFNSAKDFYEKLVLNKREVMNSKGKVNNKSFISNGQMEMLIKAGAFDDIEDKPREEVLLDFIQWVNPPKNKLTTAHISNLMNLGVIPIELQDSLRFYNYRLYVLSKNYFLDLDENDNKKSNILWYNLQENECEYQEYVEDFFNEFFSSDMTEGKDYRYEDDGTLSIAMNTKRKGSFEWKYNQLMKDFNKWLTSKEALDLYNNILLESDKKDYGYYLGRSHWEMESMSYYYSDHELSHVDNDLYGLVPFNELNEEPVIVGYNKWKDHQTPKFKLSRIVGTVLDRNTTKHLVTVLTPQGVVAVKFQQGQFAFYDKTISRMDEETGKKVTVEEGWFKRGSLVMITGYRKGNVFRPKKYKDSIYQHTVQKIKSIDKDGVLTLISDRATID